MHITPSTPKYRTACPDRNMAGTSAMHLAAEPAPGTKSQLNFRTKRQLNFLDMHHKDLMLLLSLRNPSIHSESSTYTISIAEHGGWPHMTVLVRPMR